MAGVSAGLPAGIRLSDHISLGVIAGAVPLARVRKILAETGRASERERDLPASVMVYYVIAMALYMGSSTREVLRCLLEGLRGSGVRRRSGLLARAASRRPAAGSEKRRCSGSTRSWCSRSPPPPPRGRGTVAGG